MLGMTKALALEFAASGVTFNMVPKKMRELGERLFAQIAASIQIIAPLQITIRQQLLVLIHPSRQSTRDGPYAAGIELRQPVRMRHQPRHTAVAIEERMDPHQTMMHCRRGEN